VFAGDEDRVRVSIAPRLALSFGLELVGKIRVHRAGLLGQPLDLAAAVIGGIGIQAGMLGCFRNPNELHGFSLSWAGGSWTRSLGKVGGFPHLGFTDGRDAVAGAVGMEQGLELVFKISAGATNDQMEPWGHRKSRYRRVVRRLSR
jgi:hypothetical protein